MPEYISASVLNIKKSKDNSAPAAPVEARPNGLAGIFDAVEIAKTIQEWVVFVKNEILKEDQSKRSFIDNSSYKLWRMLSDNGILKKNFNPSDSHRIVDYAFYKLRLEKSVRDFLENPNKIDFLDDLDRFSVENPGKPISAYIRKNYPEIDSFFSKASRTIEEEASKAAVLPDHPPALFKDRADKSILPVDFIREHYQPWIGKGLARNHLRTLDNYLYVQLSLQLKKDPEALDFDLPTKSVAADRWAARVKADPVAEQNAKDGQRLHSILYRRQKAGRDI